MKTDLSYGLYLLADILFKGIYLLAFVICLLVAMPFSFILYVSSAAFRRYVG